MMTWEYHMVMVLEASFREGNGKNLSEETFEQS